MTVPASTRIEPYGLAFFTHRLIIPIMDIHFDINQCEQGWWWGLSITGSGIPTPDTPGFYTFTSVKGSLGKPYFKSRAACKAAIVKRQRELPGAIGKAPIADNPENGTRLSSNLYAQK